MNKREAREFMMKHLMPRIEKYGFKQKGQATEFRIVRKGVNGEDIINGGFTDYNPKQQIIYNFYKRNIHILKILTQLEESGIRLSPLISIHTGTFGFSYETLQNLNQIGYLPVMSTETDVQKCVEIMVDFMEAIVFPILDKFENLKEIDKIINGTEPWETDWQKPYAFGGNFYEKRLIVAKLAGNPNYQQLIDFNYSTLERLSAENGHPFTYNRDDLSKPLPALIKLLEDVKPLKAV